MRLRKRKHYNEESDESNDDNNSCSNKKRNSRLTSSDSGDANDTPSISSRGRVRRLNPRLRSLLRE